MRARVLSPVRVTVPEVEVCLRETRPTATPRIPSRSAVAPNAAGVAKLFQAGCEASR